MKLRFSVRIALLSFCANLVAGIIYQVSTIVIYGGFSDASTVAALAGGLTLVVFLPMALWAGRIARPFDSESSGVLAEAELAKLDRAHRNLSIFAMVAQNVTIFFTFMLAFSVFESNPLAVLSFGFWREYFFLQSAMLLSSAFQLVGFNILAAKRRAILGSVALSPGMGLGFGWKIVVVASALVIMTAANLSSVAQIGVSEIWAEGGLARERISYRNLEAEEKLKTVRATIGANRALAAELEAWATRMEAQVEGKDLAQVDTDWLENYYYRGSLSNPLIVRMEKKSDDMVRRTALYLLVSYPLYLALLILLSRNLGQQLKLMAGVEESIRSRAQARLKVVSIDETGVLAAAFNRIMDARDRETELIRQAAARAAESETKLRGTMEEATGLARSLSAESAEVGEKAATQRLKTWEASDPIKAMVQAALSLADKLNQQNAVVDRFTSFILEIIRQTSQVIEMAAATRAITANLVETSREGERLIDHNEAASAQIRLSTASIGEITALLSDLADRTNLLAMNASIEAARAGSAGKGFAVVASEIRGLAESSARSAASIKDTIKEVAGRVDEGSAIATEAKAAFSRILRGVSETEEINRNLQGLMEVQGRGIEDVRAIIPLMSESAAVLSQMSHSQGDSAQQLNSFTQSISLSTDALETSAKNQESTVASLLSTLKRLDEVIGANRNIISELAEATGRASS